MINTRLQYALIIPKKNPTPAFFIRKSLSTPLSSRMIFAAKRSIVQKNVAQI